MFEWYDFYLYGSLAAIIAKQFFSGLNETSAFIFALLAFAAGFAVRPFGAIVFGRLGDMIGRKYTFLVTIVIMGLSTFLVGMLPSYATIGVAAPVILIVLRLLQGLALGGEYGGAATYVAEHAPHGKRGLYTSLHPDHRDARPVPVAAGDPGRAARTWASEAFEAWGWRIPFLLSIVLLGVSVWIRLQLNESPAVPADEGRGQAAPRRRSPRASFTGRTGKIVLLALLGADRRPGRGLVRGPVLRAVLPDADAEGRRRPPTYLLIAAALAIGTPFFVFFGWLSRQDRPQEDHHGRLPDRRADLLPAVQGADALRQPGASPKPAPTRRPVTVHRRSGDLLVPVRPGGQERSSPARATSPTAALAKAGVPYTIQAAPAGSVARVTIGGTEVASFEGAGLAQGRQFKAKADAFDRRADDGADGRGLSGQGRPGADQQADGVGGADDPGDAT